MAISIVGTSKNAANATSISVAPPSGYAAGDYFYAFAYSDSDGSAASMTAPSGWTSVSSGGAGGSTSPGFGKLWVKVATASESTYAFAGSASSENQVLILALRGVDTGTPLAASPVWTTAAPAATSSLVAPTVTMGAAGVLVTLHALQGVASSGNVFTAPSGMTGTEGSVSPDYYAHILVSTQQQASGASGTRTATTSNSGNTNAHGYLAMTFGVRASAGATGTVAGSGTGTSTINGVSNRQGAVSGALTGASSISAQSNRFGALTGALVGSADIVGVAPVGSWVVGELMGSAVIEGQAQELSPSGYVDGQGYGSASIEAEVITGRYFRTPAFKQHPRDRHPLIARTWIPVGMTLLKTNGSYRTYIDTDPDLITAADKVYLGGHLYFVETDEAEDLMAAGYGQFLSSDVPVSGDDDIPVTDYSQYGAGTYGTGPYGA